jgi:glycosyltransferase involved in cell wall biosynthesis
MRIAFYAPMKPPDHPVPSGDRRMAQLFLRALQGAGHEPFLASRFRSYEGAADRQRQARLAAAGARLGIRFLRRCRERPQEAPQLWFTYHLYHKAPDYLGPLVADALSIPYVVAEASFAAKRARGPWAIGQRAAERAIRRADIAIALNPEDREGILPLLSAPARFLALKPFLDATLFGRKAAREDGAARLITVAMMREGDKLASYRLLGAALAELLDLSWSLEVVGDGSARAEVTKALAPLAPRVLWAGLLGCEPLAARLAAADLYVWPAVNEAFGMALLEAEASGLPVVAGDFGGVRGVVSAGVSGLLVPPADKKAFAAAVRSLLLDRERRERMGKAACAYVRCEHDLASAARGLAEALHPLARAA